MSTVNIHQAKTHLSELVARAEAGEEIVLARAGRPVARIVPFASTREPRAPGSARGEFVVPPDFDESLPPELLAAFSG